MAAAVVSYRLENQIWRKDGEGHCIHALEARYMRVEVNYMRFQVDYMRQEMGYMRGNGGYMRPHVRMNTTTVLFSP